MSAPRIAVIGAGWYGCHLALSLKKSGYNVVLYEKNHEIFSQVSGKFGIRLHAGPHYPRSHKTRESCRRGAAAFKTQYPDLVIPHEYSIYGLGIKDADGKPSKTNQQDFDSVCKESSSRCTQINPKKYGYEGLISAYDIDEPSIAVGERLRSQFSTYLKAAGVEVRCDSEVTQSKPKGSSMIVSYKTLFDNTVFDDTFNTVINATGHQFFAQKTDDKKLLFDIEIIYQPCLALIYKDTKPDKRPFSFIVMDGWFPCLMPRIGHDEKESPSSSREYILTHGQWTIMGAYNTPEAARDVLSKIDSSFIEEQIKPLVEKEMLRFWPEFANRFNYVGWQGDIIAKLKTKREFRSALTYKEGEIIYIIPGKVTNIFDAEKEVRAFLNQKNILSLERYSYVAGGVLDEAMSEITEKPTVGEANTSHLRTFDQLQSKSTANSTSSNYSFILKYITSMLAYSARTLLAIASAILAATINTTAAVVAGIRYCGHRIFSNSIKPAPIKVIEQVPGAALIA